VKSLRGGAVEGSYLRSGEIGHQRDSERIATACVVSFRKSLDHASKSRLQIADNGLNFALLMDSKNYSAGLRSNDLIEWRPLRVQAEKAAALLSTRQYDAF